MNYYSYRRVSTNEQHNGPAAQMDIITRWADTQSMAQQRLIKPVDFFDDGVSGDVPLNERPEGKKLCEALQNDDCVVVSKLDRLFRSVGNAAITIKEWNKRDIKLISIQEGFDMTNPYGRAMAQMASVFAELEREMIRSRTKAALLSKRARCERTGDVPYGWDAKDGKLIPNAYEQSIVAHATVMRETGAPLYHIARTLNDMGCTTKKGKKWDVTRVKRMLARGKG